MNAEKLKKFFSDKRTRLVLVAVAALLLLLVVWKVFFAEKKTATVSGYQPTAREERLSALLSQIEGVSDTTVMISEENGAAVGAVVVFDGEDSILTRIKLLDVTSNALNLKKEYILVYPSGAAGR